MTKARVLCLLALVAAAAALCDETALAACGAPTGSSLCTEINSFLSCASGLDCADSLTVIGAESLSATKQCTTAKQAAVFARGGNIEIAVGAGKSICFVRDSKRTCVDSLALEETVIAQLAEKASTASVTALGTDLASLAHTVTNATDRTEALEDSVAGLSDQVALCAKTVDVEATIEDIQNSIDLLSGEQDSLAGHHANFSAQLANLREEMATTYLPAADAITTEQVQALIGTETAQRQADTAELREEFTALLEAAANALHQNLTAELVFCNVLGELRSSSSFFLFSFFSCHCCIAAGALTSVIALTSLSWMRMASQTCRAMAGVGTSSGGLQQTVHGPLSPAKAAMCLAKNTARAIRRQAIALDACLLSSRKTMSSCLVLTALAMCTSGRSKAATSCLTRSSVQCSEQKRSPFARPRKFSTPRSWLGVHPLVLSAVSSTEMRRECAPSLSTTMAAIALPR
eukprot:m.104311 g.104311  ORF g.104311 m.104311 type:complete len:462 (-) comp9099_c0_seq2:903-2288(-)